MDKIAEIVCGICKFKAWCEFDARERNAGEDVDPIEDCPHIKAILALIASEQKEQDDGLTVAYMMGAEDMKAKYKPMVEALKEWKQVVTDSYKSPMPVDRVLDMLDDLIASVLEGK